MRPRDHHRPAATLLATLAVVVGLAACSSSDAAENPTPAPVTTAAPVAGDGAVVTDAEVADLEKQLDEIDELLAGVDADLSHD